MAAADLALLEGPPDYADAFEIRVPEPDERSPEQWVRSGLEDAPRAVRRIVLVAQRHLLLLRLYAPASPENVLGWRIRTSTAAVVELEASSPLLQALLVARKVDPTCVVFTTMLRYTRPLPAWAVWAVVAPVHRRVARHLLARAASGARPVRRPRRPAGRGRRPARTA